jgi:hypothetical protein
MGFGSMLKSSVTAPFKAAGAVGKGAMGATKSLATGHPVAATKQMGGGMKASARPIKRAVSGRR